MFLSLAARHTADEPGRLEAVLAGLRRYQSAPVPPPMPPLTPVARIGGVTLRRVGGAGPPVVVVPSLINAPAVLDLAPDRSLLRFLAGRGLDVHVIDWGETGRSERRLGLAGLVSLRLLPLLARLPAPVALVGYCLGGTLAIAAAQLLGARLASVALIATPWHFDGFGPAERRRALECWRAARPIARPLGALPISLLNPLFWSLDEAAVITKYESLGRRPDGDPAIAWFAAVEDWANSGAPLSLASARDLFVQGFGQDRFGRGRWRVAGAAIDPARVTAPVMDLGATRDRIVPAAARIRAPGAVRIDVASGHVGMVVGSAARATTWEPLSNWLADR
jgi:polyhydroxyalkanoate synthase